MADSEAEIIEVQAAAGDVTLARSVPFLGKQFRIADRVGLMPLLKFAHAAASGIDTSDLRALDALYEMLRDCIHPGNGLEPGEEGYDPGDWNAFVEHAVQQKAEADDLFPVVSATIELLTARPTQPPSGSSSGQSGTSASSTGSSSARAVAASNGSRRGSAATSPTAITSRARARTSARS